MRLSATALLAIVIPSALFVVGCKSEYEKYADEACACQDQACIKTVSENHKGMLGGEKTSLKELDAKLNALPEKDKKAFEKGFECMMKIAMKDMDKGDKAKDKDTEKASK
jgi:hypothetical protein